MKKTILICSLVLIFASIGAIWYGTAALSQSNKGALPQSKLGVKGEMGFIITVVEKGSPLEQAGLRVGDIINGLNGQVTSIEKFQQDVATSAPGTEFEIWYLRFNSTNGKLEEQTVTVRSAPFTSQAQATVRNISLETRKYPNLSAQDECYGCCANCGNLVPYEQQCITENRFTGKSNCRIVNGRCRFYFCT